MAKICCGGFNLGEGLELDGKTLKATGGSGSNNLLVKLTPNEEQTVFVSDKSLAEIQNFQKSKNFGDEIIGIWWNEIDDEEEGLFIIDTKFYFDSDLICFCSDAKLEANTEGQFCTLRQQFLYPLAMEEDNKQWSAHNTNVNVAILSD